MYQIRVPADHKNPTNIPEGFRTFKCSAPGCRRTATHRAHNPALSHLPQDVGSYCEAHAAGLEVVIESPLVPTGRGRFPLYRRRQDAFGGWRGWEYAVVIIQEHSDDIL